MPEPARFPTATLPDGTKVPAFGIGTWRMGERARERAAEVTAIRLALEIGVTLIDTAEMYGEGTAEEIVAEAIGDKRARDRLFIVSKVYPHNASRAGVVAACERSLKRLRTDRIDLYLLHWPGSYPIAETVGGFEQLRNAGKIRHWGVSNFDLGEMEDVWALKEGARCASNQILYNLARRGPEFDLIPAAGRRSMPIMAYSPLDQGRLPRKAGLEAVAKRHGRTIWQIALAWTLARPGVISIPKAVDPAHLRDNVAAAHIKLTPADLAEIDRDFPPPRRKTALGML
ncbi:MAG: aldo/keto reductase [Alphaproteobacteria bacterium]|nr:aldo/keto reductase [Alphaproteobacteria bacterium]